MHALLAPLWVERWLPVPFCDLHHLFHHGGGSPSTPDPNAHAFVVTAALILLASVLLLFVGGPIIAVYTRRIRDGFWVIPLVNLAFYLAMTFLRGYPGGLGAKFRSPGAIYTVIEILLLLLMSLLVALILALARFVFRALRPRRKSPPPDVPTA